jgi:RNA polymerase sigma factor (sigma-70 family)
MIRIMKTTGVNTSSDEILIRTFRQGNPHSLGALYTRYYSKVYHTCFSFTRNQDDAFDLAQDVMLKAFSNLESFEGDSSFSTWLFSITRNYCISQTAKRKRFYYEDVQLVHNVPVDHLDPEEMESRKKKEQLETELCNYLDFLPAGDKRLLELKYFHNYSIKDLQREFKLSASAVKMRLLRARQRMEQILEVGIAA